MIDKDEVAIFLVGMITIILIPLYNHHDHWIPDEALDVVHQVLCEGERPHNEEQCNLDKCVYTDNPEIKANVDQDYMQTDPYLKVASDHHQKSRVGDDESQCPMFHPSKDPFSLKSVFARFCAAAWRKQCFHAFLFLAACGKTISAQVVKVKVGGRATVYVGTTLKVRCPVKQYDK